MPENSNETVSMSAPLRPVGFTRQDHAWMVATFILTPLTASILSIAHYIPTDPVTAAIDGVIVAIVYVGFRIGNALRRWRLFSKSSVEISSPETQSPM